MDRRHLAALDSVAVSGGSRREYAAWSCRISPAVLVAGPPSPLTEQAGIELLSITYSGYTTAPSEARQGRCATPPATTWNYAYLGADREIGGRRRRSMR